MDGEKNTSLVSLATTVKFEVQKRFKLLSWNIDGLDQRRETLVTRTHAVVDIIKREKPDAIFLQEVIPESLAILKTALLDYEPFIGNDRGYFVAIFTQREMLKVQGHEIIPYPNTKMDRNLLVVHAIYGNTLEIDLMTSHHESCKPSANERIRQLKLCFKQMVDVPQHRVVLFGGDLNMRDKELEQAGSIPAGICDLWEATGKNEEYTYTWDMQRNTNLNFSREGFLPRCRFDRLYFRRANLSAVNFRPIAFKLEGVEIIPSIHRFCSDHWAIQVEFEL